MTTTAEVSDDDFQEILAQTRQFVRSAVVPREQEILAGVTRLDATAQR